MKRIRHIILTTFITLFGLVATPFAMTAGAIDIYGGACKGNTSVVCKASTQDDLPAIVKNVINLLFFIIGVIAVIMIIIGGIRYSTSNGDSSQVQSAKNTVLYAVIGLVVAILAFAIVGFVLDRFK